MPTSRTRALRGMDLPPKVAGAGGVAIDLVADIAPPAQPSIRPPYNLTVIGSDLLRAALTPEARVQLRWRPPTGVNPTSYDIQWATNAAFTAGLGGKSAVTPDAQIRGLATGTAYWFRVRAVVGALMSGWSNVVSVTTEQDTLPPGPVTGATFLWGANGALTVSWTNPASANFSRVRLRFYQAGGGGAILHQVERLDTNYTLPFEVNRALAFGPRTGFRIEIVALNGSNIESTPVILNPAWSAPSPITVTPEFTGPDAVFTSSNSPTAVSYDWVIDGRLYAAQGRTFVYTLAENTLRHSGTPDPELTYQCTPRDVFGLGPTAPGSGSTGTVTNPPPLATTISAEGYFFTARISIVPSSATDLRNYRVRVYKAGVGLVRTFFTAETSFAYSVEDGDGAYSFDVTVYDVFGQASPASAQTTARDVRDYAAYVALLREEATYSDSLGRSSAALKAALADDDTTSGGNGANFAASASWHWVQIFRELTYRYRPLTIGRFAMASGSAGFYVATSLDGTAWRYFAGPVTVTNGVGVMTEVASEAAAQGAAVGVTSNTTITRWELPVTVEARSIRLYIRQPTAGLTLREFYAETFVRADRIQAGGITALHLAVGAVTADAILAGALDAKVITLQPGGIIRSGSSGQRFELDANGLRTYDSDGVIQIEATTATNGKLRAGAGAISIGADGFLINTPVGGALTAGNSIRFAFDGIEFGKIGAGGSFLGTVFGLLASAADASPRSAELLASNSAGYARLRVGASDTLVDTGAALTVTSGGTTREIWRGRISGTTPQFAVLGATPAGRQTLPAAATDATTERNLINAMRSLLIVFGFAQ